MTCPMAVQGSKTCPVAAIQTWPVAVQKSRTVQEDKSFLNKFSSLFRRNYVLSFLLLTNLYLFEHNMCIVPQNMPQTNQRSPSWAKGKDNRICSGRICLPGQPLDRPRILGQPQDRHWTLGQPLDRTKLGHFYKLSSFWSRSHDSCKLPSDSASLCRENSKNMLDIWKTNMFVSNPF